MYISGALEFNSKSLDSECNAGHATSVYMFVRGKLVFYLRSCLHENILHHKHFHKFADPSWHRVNAKNEYRVTDL